ncbi:MAG: hypothetical protein Kow00107_06410 [Planctomycetota bacterium]
MSLVMMAISGKTGSPNCNFRKLHTLSRKAAEIGPVRMYNFLLKNAAFFKVEVAIMPNFR